MDEQILEQLQQQVDSARLSADREGLARQQQEMYLEKEDKSMVKEQLDLSDLITRVDYLLKGYTLNPDNNGNLVWTKPISDDMIVFSDYGIQMIMNTICFYLNQNTLLSNYKEEEINKKMLDFAIELIDAIFMNYEKVFAYPTVSDCIAALKARIEKKVEVSAYAYGLQGKKISLDEIRASKVAEIEDRVELEIEKIRQNIIKEKLKRFPLLVRVIQDAVHSTYQRAWNGQERGTLRQHTHISESRGNQLPITHPQAGGLFSWGRK